MVSFCILSHAVSVVEPQTSIYQRALEQDYWAQGEPPKKLVGKVHGCVSRTVVSSLPGLSTSRFQCSFWQIYGWDPSGNIELWDITCDNNTATESGGCFNTHGRGIVTNGTVMNGNVAYAGGCICEFHSVGVCRAVVELQ